MLESKEELGVGIASTGTSRDTFKLGPSTAASVRAEETGGNDVLTVQHR